MAAGLTTGDIILKVDDEQVLTTPGFVDAIQRRAPGSKVLLTGFRGDTSLSVTATVGQVTINVIPPRLMQDGEAKRVHWLARDHAITVLPAVSSLKALRAVARPSRATKQLIGFGNPLLDGPQDDPQFGAYFKEQAAKARMQTRCASAAALNSAALRGPDRSVSPLPRQGNRIDTERIRRLMPLPETAGELCAVTRDLKADTNDI